MNNTRARLFHAYVYKPSTPEGMRPYDHLLIPAHTHAEAVQLMQDEGWIGHETYVMTDAGAQQVDDHNGKHCYVTNAWAHSTPTIEAHARWVGHMTVDFLLDGERVKAPFTRVRPLAETVVPA